MDNLWHMMPRSDISPPKTQAPHERIRTTAKAKETDLKKVMVRLRYFWSVEKMANLLEIWVPFFSCRKTFCTGIRRASNSIAGCKFTTVTCKISDLRWLCHAVLQKISSLNLTGPRPWILWVFVCRSSDFNHLKNEVFRWLNGWWVV